MGRSRPAVRLRRETGRSPMPVLQMTLSEWGTRAARADVARAAGRRGVLGQGLASAPHAAGPGWPSAGGGCAGGWGGGTGRWGRCAGTLSRAAGQSSTRRDSRVLADRWSGSGACAASRGRCSATSYPDVWARCSMWARLGQSGPVTSRVSMLRPSSSQVCAGLGSVVDGGRAASCRGGSAAVGVAPVLDPLSSWRPRRAARAATGQFVGQRGPLASASRSSAGTSAPSRSAVSSRAVSCGQLGSSSSRGCSCRASARRRSCRSVESAPAWSSRRRGAVELLLRLGVRGQRRGRPGGAQVGLVDVGRPATRLAARPARAGRSRRAAAATSWARCSRSRCACRWRRAGRGRGGARVGRTSSRSSSGRRPAARGRRAARARRCRPAAAAESGRAWRPAGTGAARAGPQPGRGRSAAPPAGSRRPASAQAAHGG